MKDKLIMVWKHLGYQDIPFATMILEINLQYKECWNAPLLVFFLGMGN